MGAQTKIEWAANKDGSPGATWNVIRGCSRISEGCRNCYAERMASRFSAEGEPFHQFATRTPSGPRWTGRVELIPEMLDVPLRRRKPTTYFVNSMSDLFHEALPDEAIDRVFAVMALCPQHRFIVLTKRAERMAEWFAQKGGTYKETSQTRVAKGAGERASIWANSDEWDGYLDRLAWPLPNVILGVSCEDQAAADERIPHLLRTPAVCRFVSLEPLLGPIDIGTYLSDLDGGFGVQMFAGVDWVIVGGESGPGARPMNESWVRSIRDQCVSAGTAMFYKQRLDGGRKVSLPELDGRVWSERPEVLR